MLRARRVVPALLAALGSASVAAGPALACSPPLVPPTLRDLGPDQVVVVGTIAERVAGGRLFHVERWFNGGTATTPIVIAFEEGPAAGDCRYPVATGQRLIIAPAMGADGTLAADLVTLQADPATDDGRAYLAEARDLYGDGVVPEAAVPDRVEPGDSGPAAWLVVAATAAAVLALFGGVAVVARRRAGS